MQIAQNFATKLYVAFVVIAMMLMAVAPAQAKTAEELQAEITALMATINELQSQVGQGGTSVASGICPYSWTRSLSSGSTGDDVKKLQMFLNASEDTRVAMAGAGSVGAETMYYGPATAAAVSKFQVKYRADILSPGGLVNPTGYFGPASIAKANALCVSSPNDADDEGTDDGDDADEDDSDSALQGEGTLDSFEIDDASDTDLQEGAEDEEIAELTMEATDGDIEVSRIDIALSTDGTDDPWDVFEEISLWVDGEEVATMAADDEDEYLDEDDGSLRFTDLGLVLREDEEVEVTVAATVQGSVDDVPAGWSVEVNAVRYFDADDVATTEEEEGDIDDLGSAPTADFTLVEEGDGEELKFSLGDGNPDATDVVVDENGTTDGVTVLEYTIEAKDGDIEVNSLFVNVQTSTTTSNVVDDIELDIDGQSFKDEPVATGKTVVNSATSTTYKFDIDGDVVIDDGDEVTVKVMVDFKSQESSTNVDRYSNGTTIKASVTSTERDDTDAEGNGDLDYTEGDFTGSAVGDTHTLVAEGIVVPADGVEVSEVLSGTDEAQTGTFKIEFEVTAVEGDFYITDNTSLSQTNGVEFSVEGATTSIAANATLASTGNEDNAGVFTVSEGDTETFTLTVTLDVAAAGQYRVTLDEVWFSTDDDGTTGAEVYLPTPASDYRTDYLQIAA